MPMKVATYNVLATAYIEPARYPLTPPECLDATTRLAALTAHLIRLDADILCLQEVEAEVFSHIHRALSQHGYTGAWSKKGGSKPDGCATFVRQQSLAWVRLCRVQYHDASGVQARSEHIAQLVVLNAAGRFLGVANTHVKWDPPSTPRQQRYAYRQLTELLRVRHELAPECSGWIVCGDFNVTAQDEVLDILHSAGLQYSHAHMPGVATCNANRRAKMIDYLFHDDAIISTALDVPHVDDNTPLPGPEQPSDHVALMAYCRWQEAP